MTDTAAVQEASKKLAGYSLTTGVVRYADLTYLVAAHDENVREKIASTLMLEVDQGRWGADALGYAACSLSVCHVPAERQITLGAWGEINVSGGGEVREEAPIVCEGAVPRQRGPLREVRGIARGRAYAVGTCRQAYVREAPDQWRCIDQSAQVYTAGVEPTDTCFESIDGFSEQDVYTVGWEGEIWRYDGSRFRQLASPTSLALYKVRCAPDGQAYACGQLGTLLRGLGDDWVPIAQGDVGQDLWGLEIFNGQVFVASLHGVYRLEGDRLVPVDFGDEVPATCYHLSAADGLLWSIGAKDVMQFDGSRWSRILRLV